MNGRAGGAWLWLASGILAVLMATPALADPCRAVPEKGRLPDYLAKGALFSGPVTYIADGDGLCIEVGGRGATSGWVEVRLQDFYAPELDQAGPGFTAKRALEGLTRGREVTCISSGRKSWDRVVAVCRLDGRSLGDWMRAAGVAEGGRGKAP